MGVLIMTKEDLKNALSEIVLRQGKYPDAERDHCDADDLLLQFIGDEEISEIYDNISKWYA